MGNKILNFVPKRKGRDVFMCQTLRKLQGESARGLLEKYQVSSEPPINIDELAEKIGITVIPKDFSDIERKVDIATGTILGATVSHGEDVSIFFRENDTENRRRFTIAHEIAHCCLHTENLIEYHVELRNNAIATSGREYEANIFAGELLIPERTLRKICSMFIMPSLSSLTEIFKVSSAVMSARLDYLNIQYLKDVKVEEA